MSAQRNSAHASGAAQISPRLSGSTTNPCLGSHTIFWQKYSSSGIGRGVPPPQTPAEQVSWVVQASASSQSSPSWLGTSSHSPVLPSQVAT
ncbi:MAG: hypothetical protein IPM79_23980 [Polyangiaceae bacterium]|nr:hypothetical protein [Polyangiaceae bacterium]